MAGNLADTRGLLLDASAKLGEALDLLDPILAAETRGRARALVEVAREILEEHISRRSGGQRKSLDRASVVVTEAAAVCGDPT
jgi:hypothetical protein